jgi:ribosomal-protein-alanine N-acetyltransferase
VILGLPVLDDGTVSVRLLTPGDAPWVASAVAAGETCCLGPVPGPLTVPDARAMIVSWEDARGEGLGLALAAQDKDRLVGLLVLQTVEPGDVEVAYWIAAAERGRGYATRAVGLVSRWLAGSPGAPRVWLETDPDNRASQRVAEKTGFERERLARDHCERDGKPHDCVIYALPASG